MEGISLDFHCFKALNNNLEARLFLHVHFYASSDLFKLGTVLTYAFNISIMKKRNFLAYEMPLLGVVYVVA